ncbi:sulfurtransferase complex subunit TusD [Buchnera aphidicola]|uniref:sulfurtransferase complex subunit TusD n=1 Tax=Buchnera aphidicola TaxID=9 RepID=UPI0034638921
MSIYTILVMGSPHSTENAISAFLCAKCLLKNKKNNIKNIFFYGNGVLNANNMINTPIESINLVREWYQLSKFFFIKLYICISSAQEKGILSNEMSKSLGFLHGNLHKGFYLTGLSTLVYSMLSSDHFLQF